MVKRPTLFLNSISCKDLRFYNTSNCWFSQNSLLERGETDGQSPVLHGEAMWPPLIPLQAAKCCSNKSPNAPTFFLALSVNPFCFLLFFFPVWKCSFVAGRVLTASLSLNSLLALGLSKMPLSVCVCVCCFFLILLFCFFLSCLLARLSLFTLVMSKLLPLNRLQCRNPRRRGSQQGAQKLIHVRAISLMNQIRHDNTYSQVNKHTLRGCNTYTHF